MLVCHFDQICNHFDDIENSCMLLLCDLSIGYIHWMIFAFWSRSSLKCFCNIKVQWSSLMETGIVLLTSMLMWLEMYHAMFTFSRAFFVCLLDHRLLLIFLVPYLQYLVIMNCLLKESFWSSSGCIGNMSMLWISYLLKWGQMGLLMGSRDWLSREDLHQKILRASSEDMSVSFYMNCQI